MLLLDFVGNSLSCYGIWMAMRSAHCCCVTSLSQLDGSASVASSTAWTGDVLRVPLLLMIRRINNCQYCFMPELPVLHPVT